MGNVSLSTNCILQWVVRDEMMEQESLSCLRVSLIQMEEINDLYRLVSRIRYKKGPVIILEDGVGMRYL